MTTRVVPAIEGASLIEVPDDLDAINRLYIERRWSDGLPIIPPTQARVQAMLEGSVRHRLEIVARVAPAFGAATVEHIAVNAVMAGCRPGCMPVLIAAVEAVCDPTFNLQAVQVTTNPVAVFLIVNGPIAERLEMNAGMNCLGQGAWSNASLGRALHLILQNVGGARPGEMDRATHGQPGKFTFCCSENEGESPWPPLHVERGLRPGSSAVTVVAAAGTLNMNMHAKDADGLVKSMANSLAFASSNDYWLGGEPWIVISPEHAEVLHRGGVDKAQLQRRLWEDSKMPAGRMSQKDMERTRLSRGSELGPIDAETLLPVSVRPEGIGIVVAGGPGTHSVYVPSFGDSRAVTREVCVEQRSAS